MIFFQQEYTLKNKEKKKRLDMQTKAKKSKKCKQPLNFLKEQIPL